MKRVLSLCALQEIIDKRTYWLVIVCLLIAAYGELRIYLENV